MPNVYSLFNGLLVIVNFCKCCITICLNTCYFFIVHNFEQFNLVQRIYLHCSAVPVHHAIVIQIEKLEIVGCKFGCKILF